MNRKAIIIIAGCLLALICGAHAQKIKGVVIDNKKQPLTGASVYWSDSWKGSTSNENGYFELSKHISDGDLLVVSFVGFQSDTISVKDVSKRLKIILQENIALQEVEIVSRSSGTYVSSISPALTKVINQTELRKAACCDLAGCFETEASVQATTTNIITNTKELRILGLSGVYNQLLLDGMPLFSGLPYTYGISCIPGTLVENIHVSKGANSVLQGYESMTGQINVITQTPDKADKLFVNAFINSYQEKQFNVNFAMKGKQWQNLTAVHITQPGVREDKDEDTFMDSPLLTRYTIFNALNYRHADSLGLSSSLNMRYVDEKRLGGQMDYNYAHEGSTDFYGQTFNSNQPMAYGKLNYRFDTKNRLRFHFAAYTHMQQAWFGVTQYDAKQNSLYGNLEYERLYGTSNTLKAGLSYRVLDLEESIRFHTNELNRTYDGEYSIRESIPGLFIENTLSLSENKLMLITGLRLDSHNNYGIQTTPRALIKYQINTKTDVRFSAGLGWRTVNPFAENIGLLASSRNIIIQKDLEPEKAWNFGTNFTHKHQWDQISLTLGVDLYHTRFMNQIYPDYSSDPTKAYIDNFFGKSISNGFQLETSWSLYQRLEAKIAYNYLDVYRVRDGEKKALEFNPKHKLNTSLSYSPLSNKWQADLNLVWMGKQQMPNTQANPVAYQLNDESEAYTLVNVQLQRKWNRFEIYGGCENLFDFRQKRPIISWQDPFGAYFDTSSAWGPTKGRELYLGLRFTI
ncbi:MAG: TonB-dependent receptor [Bacteroidales bacterium]|nr:TonB-dependent receptor [Bacteroidales bacterium]